MLKKYAFYFLVGCLFFAGQFLHSSDLVTGKPPSIEQTTITGLPAQAFIAQGPAIIYFWAEWCGICAMMQNAISAMASDYPQLTIALRSGTDNAIKAHLQKNQLLWSVVNDQQGKVAQSFGVKAVPAVFFLNKDGTIVFTSVGYSSEWGLRIRTWLAGLI
ncbi:protein disulfide oxidoreductase [Methylomonas sp. AM2-LC]|uniref:protein disulfide oxidoreductase n=1 Tax=Methylomonas sp. AM2-LC TaxID=3153301 RepID=UPI003264B314